MACRTHHLPSMARSADREEQWTSQRIRRELQVLPQLESSEQLYVASAQSKYRSASEKEHRVFSEAGRKCIADRRLRSSGTVLQNRWAGNACFCGDSSRMLLKCGASSMQASMFQTW